MTEPAALTTARAATVVPSVIVALAMPNPPLMPAVSAPVPAPTLPCAVAVGRAAADCLPAERSVGPVVEPTAAPEIEDHGGGDDRHDGTGVVADGVADLVGGQPRHHSIGGGEAEGAAAGQAHGMDLLDEVLGPEQIGLARAGRATAHVDAGGCTARCEYDGGTGQPSRTRPAVVPDEQSRHVGERSAGGGADRARHGADCRAESRPLSTGSNGASRMLCAPGGAKSWNQSCSTPGGTTTRWSNDPSSCNT